MEHNIDEENNKDNFKKSDDMKEVAAADPPPYLAREGQSSSGPAVSSSQAGVNQQPSVNNAEPNWQQNYQYSGGYVNTAFNYGGVHIGNIPPGAVPVGGPMNGLPPYSDNQMQGNFPPRPPGPPGIVEEQWRQGLFSCFDNIGICLATFICPEFTYFFVAYYSKRTAYWFGSFVLMMLNFIFGIAYYLSALTMGHRSVGFLLTIVLYLITLAVGFLRVAVLIFFRLRIREDYNIKGHAAEDAMVTCCCGPCSLCQMMNEVDHQMLITGRRTVFTRH